jgi:hypothetical protein
MAFRTHRASWRRGSGQGAAVTAVTAESGGACAVLRFARHTRLCPSHLSQPSHIGLRDQPQLTRATWSPLIAVGHFELGAPVASALSIRKA